MSKRRGLFIAALLASAVLTPALPARAQEAWTVRPEWVGAHESFLASPALRGRGSATADETVAATYVASVFQAYGLTPAPGLTGFLQSAGVTKTTPSGHSILTVGDLTLTEGGGLTVLSGSNTPVSGALAVPGGTGPHFRLPRSCWSLHRKAMRSAAGSTRRAGRGQGCSSCARRTF